MSTTDQDTAAAADIPVDAAEVTIREPAPAAEPAKRDRPRGDVLGRLLDDPEWHDVPRLAASASLPPVPSFTTGNPTYDACVPVTEAETRMSVEQLYTAAWLRTRSHDTEQTAA
jgi:hypothetical protein